MMLQIQTIKINNKLTPNKKYTMKSNIHFGNSIVQHDKFEGTKTNNMSLEMSIQKAFGKNDVRGIYGKDVTEELFYHTGKGYISYLLTEINKNSEKKIEAKDIWVSVCKDARTHSPSLTNALIKGITSTGANVLDLGMAPTPIGYYSEFAQIPQNIIPNGKVNGALIVTASHNPSEYNGLKMTFNKSSLSAEQIKEVREHTKNQIKSPKSDIKKGKTINYNIVKQYHKELLDEFRSIGKGIKVVTDCGNATAGIVAPKLYKDLGCKVVELYTEPDGTFPNHHPNPSDEKTLDSLKKAVIEHKADIGIAFDGDSDRIGVVDAKGQIIAGDKLLMIYAQDICEPLIKQGKKPAIVSEVKCSQVLYDKINKLGGNAIMTKTGHGYIKSKMKETNALFAGEMSGHTFFKDRYYGFDDAIYAGCRIIEILAKNKKDKPNFEIKNMLNDFEGVHSSKEIRMHCPNELKKAVFEDIKNKITNNKNLFNAKIKDIVTIDGMRIIFEDGFALIRQSNTEPVFTLRFEAKSKENCEKYQEIFLEELAKVIENYKTQE